MAGAPPWGPMMDTAGPSARPAASAIPALLAAVRGLPLGRAEADRHGRADRRPVGPGDRGAQTLADGACLLDPGAREERKELVTADADGDIGAAELQEQELAD